MSPTLTGVMPEDFDAALQAAVWSVLPDVAEVADLGHWRPDGGGRWSSPAPRRLAASAGMPVALLATRLATALGERLELAADGGVVEVAGDGFLLVTPDADGLRSVVTAVLAAGPGYGRPSRPVPSMVVDPTVPQRRTLDNLLFVVMWAHSRCCVVLNRKTTDGTAPAALTEGVLVLLLADLPRALAAAGDDPAVVLRRLHEVAAATHAWLDESGDRDGWLDGSDVRERGRLPLVEAVRQVLATGLDVLGLPAPTRC